MYKINSNDENLQVAIEELFEWYDDKILNEDFKKILVKLRDTKPDTLTNDEGEILIETYNTYQTIMEEIGTITEIMNREDD
jgi:hypothetical protein